MISRQCFENGLQPIALSSLSKRPLVSVLSSNRNYGAYLAESVESVLGQWYSNFEYIICDDGSTDNSRSILERYESADRRIRVILQENAGQAAALNAAFNASRGEILCLLDSDDLWAPEKVRNVVAAFTASPSSGFAIHKLARVDGSRSQSLGEIPLVYALPSGWLGAQAPVDAPWVPRGIPPCSALSLRRVVAERIFPLPVGLRAFADTPIQVLAPLLTPILALDQPLGVYRIHGQNAGAVKSFTEVHVRRLVDFDRELWQVWRGFLASSSCKHPIPSKPPITQNRYVYARFRREPGTGRVYRAFVAGPHFRGLPALYRAFWKASSWLPDWAFRRAFELVQGQRSTKLVLAGALQRLCRFKDVTHVFNRPDKRLRSKTGKSVGD